MNNYAIILAAGKGTRMKSDLPKVVFKVLEKPMVLHVIDNLKKAGVNNLVSVVGFKNEIVKEVIQDQTEYAYQYEQLGTGHAIMQVKDLLANKEGQTIIICGDTPLIQSSTIEKLLKYHNENNNAATILTGVLENSTGYGRIIRDHNHQVLRIVEQKDANESELLVKEINTGTYVFDNKLLFEALALINNNNAQGEYYLTDVIQILNEKNHRVDGLVIDDLNETLGVNDRVALAQCETYLKKIINEKHMINGVTIIDPASTYIGSDVTIEAETVIYPNSYLYGQTSVGGYCEIGPNTYLNNATIKSNSKVIFSHVDDSMIDEHSKVGPYVRLRQQCEIGSHVAIGNFVEMKKAKFGNHSKSAHLSYIGDAVVGENVNIGCGTITVNYDGTNKHQTTIKDNAFIGCNANLIAPVTINENAFVAAGSTITKEVPTNALAIARNKQENKLDYVSRMNKIKNK